MFDFDRVAWVVDTFAEPQRGKVECVGGWRHLECYEDLLCSRLRGRPFVFWSEVPLLDALPRRRLRNAMKRLVINGSSAFVVPGPAGAAYLESLGAPPERIHHAPNAV